MLGKKRASELGKRSGRVRKRRLSPEKRQDIARWARAVREQRRRGETTFVTLRRRLIKLVSAEDGDLAAFLKFLSRLPASRVARVYEAALSDQEQEFAERKLEEVLNGV